MPSNISSLSSARVNTLVNQAREATPLDTQSKFFYMGPIDRFREGLRSLCKMLFGEAKKPQLETAWSKIDTMHRKVFTGQDNIPPAFAVFRPLAMLSAISLVAKRDDMVVKLNCTTKEDSQYKVSNVYVTVKNRNEHDLVGNLSDVIMPTKWFATKDGYFSYIGEQSIKVIKDEVNAKNPADKINAAKEEVTGWTMGTSTVSACEALLEKVDKQINLEFLLQGGFYLLNQENLEKFRDLLKMPTLQNALKQPQCTGNPKYTADQLTAIKTAVKNYQQALNEFECGSTQ